MEWNNPAIRTLHYAWMAFFITFILWFGMGPLAAFIKVEFALSDAEWKALLMLNVAITIPARVLTGMLVDKFGPRKVYVLVLVVSGGISIAFACAQTYTQLAIARFLMGFVGAGFVIGIRLVAEWFPARNVGLAEGIYGGFGNFGSAAAAALLPLLAAAFAPALGWRIALSVAGVMAILFAFVFYRGVRNTPKGSTYFKPKKSGGLEVSSWQDLWFYLIMNLPLHIALIVLVWSLAPGHLGLLSQFWANVAWGVIALLAFYQFRKILHVNLAHLRDGVPEIQRYKFRQVAILSLAYFAAFGSEIAVVSMLPIFFMDVFGLTPVQAGFSTAGFVVANLVARPAGGWLSDRIGRRLALAIQIGGLAVGYALMSFIDAGWPLWLALTVTVINSLFVQAGCGGVYAVIPLIKRSQTGQIAGMTGAYGNVGGVIFLTVLSFVSASAFFMIMAACAAFVFLAVLFLEEPPRQLVEVLPDGTVELIDVH
ncbi:Putative nitrate transporter [gamma proteobacterium HdN1]|nr:Putative nitrate transporter [gamma proteobacterium HdN1]